MNNSHRASKAAFSVLKLEEALNVPSGFYKVKISDCAFSTHLTIGEYCTVGFELLDQKFSNQKITKIFSNCPFSSETISKFAEFAQKFFDFNSLWDIDPENLVGRECVIGVRLMGIPQITEIIPA